MQCDAITILYMRCDCFLFVLDGCKRRHTHEDCLLEWLRHSGKDTCELCGALFRFTPVYDPEAPQCVPVHQVCVHG